MTEPSANGILKYVTSVDVEYMKPNIYEIRFKLATGKRAKMPDYNIVQDCPEDLAKEVMECFQYPKEFTSELVYMIDSKLKEYS